MKTLLLEIGTEEIPAGYIKPALKGLSSLLLQRLTMERIGYGSATTFGTPRRLAVEVRDVPDRQRPLATEVIGPPERVGFDEDGNPTVAAKKFAKRVGISVKSLKVKKTERGAYLCARKREPALATKTLLKEILPDLITAIPFPKTMKWADLNIEFARPIHSILALLGETVIPFKLGNIKSGRYTSGHKFMHPERIKVADPCDYVKILREASVLVDFKERKKSVEKEISKVASDLGKRVLPDSELVDTVTNLVEYPVAVAGRMDEAFLDLPDVVLTAAMREHQKYFGVIGKKKSLAPYFIAVNDTRAKDMAQVAKGHERVLRARLKDAQFFCSSDLKSSLDDWTEKLKGVCFEARLGSVYEKVARIVKIAGFLADAAGCEQDLKREVIRAAWLCKADLVSQIVIEFPKLQGVIGKVYASIAGEPDSVASAIEEHYWPSHSGSLPPTTPAGAILGIADRIDSLCGCFSIRLIPTGTSDPYALRRQGTGIVQIILDQRFSFSLKELIEKSAQLFEKKGASGVKETVDTVYTFLQNRTAYLLAEEGVSKDVIAATVSSFCDHLPNLWKRADALERFKTGPDFEPVITAFKRIDNIIKKAGYSETGDVDKSLFQNRCESALFAACKEIEGKVASDMERGSFDQALCDIASLRRQVDDFFDGVLVLSDDADIRRNRLALLKHTADLFRTFADFSKIKGSRSRLKTEIGN